MINIKHSRITTVLIIIPFLWLCIGDAHVFAGQTDDLTQARQLIEQGDYEGALQVLEEYIEKIRQIAEQKKNIAEAYYIIAKIYYTIGESELSDANLKLVFESHPGFLAKEPDLAFQGRVDDIKKKVLSSQRQQIEERPLEIRKPVVQEKIGKPKKKKFPLAIVLGVVAVVGASALFLFKKKDDETQDPPQHGNIAITSDPTGATVYLDGADTGQITDCTLSNISVGIHQLKFELTTYGMWEGSVNVIANQTANVDATLAGFTYEYVTQWGSYGTGNGQFFGPNGVSIDSYDYLYVADSYNYRIQKFSSSGMLYEIMGSQGSGDGQFQLPFDVALDSSGYIYVVDMNNHRIQKFTSSWDFITKWGSFGSGDGQLYTPIGIAVDNSGYVYVADSVNHRIQKFTSSGIFVTKWGSEGNGDGQLKYPYSLAADNSGNVYVADTHNHRIQKFTSSGVFVTKWGSAGSGDGQLDYPKGIAVDSSGYVYAADTGNNRIQKFTSSGIVHTKWGSAGSGDGQFDGPVGVCVDKDGYVYIVDNGNRRVQKFQMSTETSLEAEISYSPITISPILTNPALRPGMTPGSIFRGKGTNPTESAKQQQKKQTSRKGKR